MEITSCVLGFIIALKVIISLALLCIKVNGFFNNYVVLCIKVFASRIYNTGSEAF